ncbi:MAG: response regulator [Pseudomonadota bacterium]
MSPTPATILIIEDNPADAALITEQLVSAGNDDLRVDNVSSLADGFERIDNSDVGAVLLDLSLPDSHGIATFTRAYERLPEIPIVVLTGNDDERLGVQAVQNGAQDYLVKGKVDGVTLGRTLRYAVLRKQVDSELRRAQCMQVTNELAGGLAHDFNNLLMVLLGKLQTLEWPLRNNEALLAQVRSATDVILDGATLTQRLLTLAQHSSGNSERLSLAECVTSLEPALTRSLGEHTPLSVDCDSETACVEVDRAALETVIMTLVASARDAMLGSGRIGLRVAPGPALRGRGGASASVSITDIGIAAMQAGTDDAFRPDFSDRNDSSGKGLALAMCASFAEQFGGEVDVVALNDGGKTVTLRLPAVAAADAAAGAAATKLNVGGRVLLLEENHVVRGVTADFLDRIGAEVVVADSAAAALAAAAGSPFDVLILEPTLSGGVAAARLLREILKLQPGIRILMTPAGLAQPPALPEHVVATTLPKPYRQADLEFALSALLAGVAPASDDHH